MSNFVLIGYKIIHNVTQTNSFLIKTHNQTSNISKPGYPGYIQDKLLSKVHGSD